MGYSKIKQGSDRVVVEFLSGFEAKKVLKLPPEEAMSGAYDYEGCIRYNGVIEYHNGVDWVPVSSPPLEAKTIRDTVPISLLITDTELVDASILGMIYIGRVPYDYVEDGIIHDVVLGTLDLTSVGDVSGQSILITILK